MKSEKSAPAPKKRSIWHVFRSKRVMVFWGMVLAVSLLVAGGTATYLGVVMPNKPQNVLRSSLATTLTSIHDRGLQRAHINVTATGRANGKKTSLNVSGFVAANGQMDISAKLTSGQKGANLTGEFRSPDGKYMYFNIRGLKELDRTLLYGGYADQRLSAGYALNAIYSKLEGKWTVATKNLSYSVGQTQPTVSNAQSQIVSAYKANEFFKVTKQLPDQAVDGMRSYHYRVAIDQTRLQNFEHQLKTTNQNAIQRFNPYLYTIIAQDRGTSTRTFDAWIDKRTKYIDKVAFSYYYNKSYNFTAVITLTRFNRPFVVPRPHNAQQLKPILDKAKVNPLDVLLGTYYPPLN